MFLPKLESDIFRTTSLGRRPNIPCRPTGSADVHTDIRPQRPLQSRHVRLIGQAIPHGAEQPLEIGPTEIRPRPELGERIDVGADGVEVDVGGGVRVEFLGEVGVDAEELGATDAVCGGGGLGFERGEQGLEPLEGAGVLGDPDELDAAQTLGRVRPAAQVPDVLEDRGPGCDADAGADQHGDLVVEYVFGWRPVRPVDPQLRHLLPVLQRDLVHAHRVKAVVFFGLGRPAAERVAE